MATERRIDEDVKKQLIGMLPFSSSRQVDFTPEKYDCIPEEYRPVFKMRPLTTAEAENVKETLIKMKDLKTIDLERRTKEAVRKCLVGWDNFIDIGKEEYIEYKEDAICGCDKELFSAIPTSIIGDMFFYLTKLSGLLDIEKLSLKS